MKMSILSLCLLGCFSLQAQEEPLKKANTIIISNDFSLQENIKHVTEMLFEAGYGIHNSDANAGAITTTEKSFKNGTIKLNILIKEKKITIRGNFKTDISVSIGAVTAEAGQRMVENIGGKNSPYRNAWDDMNKLALLLPGEKSYEIR